MNFYDKFIHLCNKNGIKPTRATTEIGLNRSAATRWKSGMMPSRSNMLKIAEYFSVSYNSLSDNEKEIEYEEHEKEGAEILNTVEVDILGSVRAGYDGIAEVKTGEKAVFATFKNKNPQDYFALRVSGNSMYPKILDGDIVLVKRSSSVDSGKIAVVIYNGNEATVKKVEYKFGENWMDLIPANPEYMTRHIEGADLEKCLVLGEVVELQRKME